VKVEKRIVDRLRGVNVRAGADDAVKNDLYL
jgi:hypothetical protein